MSLLAALVLAGAALAFPSGKAQAMKIQEVTSPGGIRAWLVEEHSVPLMAMRFAFDGGGNSQDPEGKEGVASFLSTMMDEGAGDLTAKQFQERMEEIAMRMSFNDGRDAFYGSFETLTEHREKALALLALAVARPRFDAEAVERMRKQLQAGLASAARDPTRVASEQWMALAFPGHPYGRSGNGTLQSVAKIGRKDLVDFHARTFAKDTLRVVVVGDIDAATLGGVLDGVLGGQPAKARLTPVAKVEPKAAQRLKVIDMNVPQSVVRFGLPAMARKDKDFMAAFVLNTILGGGAFTSRLYQEVREKRGLAYGVHSSLVNLRHSAIFMASTQASADNTREALELIEAQTRRMVEEGPTADELAKAKSYLKGSYPLNFDTSGKFANLLLQIQLDDLGIDYIDRRNSLIDAVTIADARRAAKRLAQGGMLVTVVGQPKGLASKQPGG
jgi:zinc protease